MFSRENSPCISLVINTNYSRLTVKCSVCDFSLTTDSDFFVGVLLMFLFLSARAFLEWGDHRGTQEDKVKGYV